MTTPSAENHAQVTITGRNVEVPEHFAERVKNKLAKIARLDPTLTYFHVELQHEPNPRREDQADRIQITATGKGHLARAEAKEDSFYAALETALAKLERSLRKVKVRREHVKSGHRAQKGTGELAAELQAQRTEEAQQAQQTAEAQQAELLAKEDRYVDPYAETIEDQRPGQIVRTKVHSAVPISVDEALSEMELVGHDFYLFIDADTQRPSVVYRRHAYDYGIIALAADAAS